MSDNIKLSYLSRDYKSLVEELKERVPELTSDWNDFSDSDVGMIILKLFAAIKDMQEYQLDKSFLESFLSTANQPENIRRIVSLVGYNWGTRTAGRINVVSTGSLVVYRGDSFILYQSGTTSSFYYTYLGEQSTEITPSNKVMLYQGSLASAQITEGMQVSSSVNGKIFSGVKTAWVENSAGEEMSDFVQVEDGTIARKNLDRNSEDTNVYFWFEPYEDYTKVGFAYHEDLRATGIYGESYVLRYLLTNAAAVNPAVGNMLEYAADNEAYRGFTVSITDVFAGRGLLSVEEVREDVPKFVRTMDSLVTLPDYRYGVVEIIRSLPSISESRDIAVCAFDSYLNDRWRTLYGDGAYIVGSGDPDVPLDYFNVWVSSYTATDNGTGWQDVKIVWSDADAIKKQLADELDEKRMAAVNIELMEEQSDFPGVSRVALKFIVSKLTGPISVDSRNELVSRIRELYKFSDDAFGRQIMQSDIVNLGIVYGVSISVQKNINGQGFTYVEFTSGVEAHKLNELVYLDSVDFN